FRTPSLGELARAWKVLAVGTAAYVAVAAATFVVMDLLRFEWRWQEVVDVVRTAESVWVLVLVCLLAVVIAPFVEEMVFRSVLYLPLRSRLGVVPAALIVSAAFAAVHGYARGTAQLAVLSLIFIALFERTGTLWAPIVAHGLYNGLTILVIRTILPSG
ncbi:MAG: CPBP family intramembrane metalloprotease, partial [Candidatus Brocadiae bacterium]|nr:CPBP family intramembrane metalloprotease [Candidatus Brocadiia bacterium]